MILCRLGGLDNTRQHILPGINRATLYTLTRPAASWIKIGFPAYQPSKEIDGQALSCDGPRQSNTISYANSKPSPYPIVPKTARCHEQTCWLT
jgi:hypothetical protein